MKIKVDEKVTVDAASALSDAGHDADTVTDEGLAGVDDAGLVARCASEGRLLITFDMGLGDLRVHPPQTHAGVVLMRLRSQAPASTLSALGRLLREYDLESFSGALVVVTEESIRIRRQ